MKLFQKKYLLVGIFILIGLTAGFFYWRFIGCKSGSCPITSNWYASSIMGGLIGFLAGDSTNDLIKKRNKNSSLLN